MNCDDYITELRDTGSHHINMILQVSLVTDQDASNQQCQDDLASFSHQPVKAVNHNTTVETNWYAPYNTLLQHVFKYVDGFGVAPQYSLYESRESIDFTTIYIVQRNQHPVFILEIKPHPNLIDISRCISADVRICQCFDKLWCHIVIPWLHVVLTMGTTFATYKLDKPSKCVTLAEILSTDKDTIQDLAPQSWWKLDSGTCWRGNFPWDCWGCQSNVFQHLSIISRSILHISLSPLTHSKSFTQTWFQMGGLAPSLHNFPSTGALVAIDVTSFFLPHFCTCVSREYEIYFVCLSLQNSN